jgi:YVTN family beta-propeller protein
VDPAGKFAYVTNSGSNDVSMYTIDATTGALTSMGTIAAGTDPVSVAVDPAGKFAYVTNSGSNDVSMYTINSHYRVLNTHRNDSGGAVSYLDSHTSVGQVRLCDEFRLERRLDVQHWFHRDLDTHRDNRHMKGQIYARGEFCR